jgi:hypothetical protein
MIAATLPRVGVPPEGLGKRITEMTAWLDDNSGANGWAMGAFLSHRQTKCKRGGRSLA